MTLTPKQIAEALPPNAIALEYLDLIRDLVLEAAVTRAHGNQSEAARTMGIHRRTIQMALARVAQHRKAQRHETL